MSLTIANIKEEAYPAIFLVEDVFTKELFHMTIPGKMRLSCKPKIGDEVYALRSPYSPDRGILITETDFKFDETGMLWREKAMIDTKRKDLSD